MKLNDLYFGNTNRTHLQYSKIENYLDTLLDELKNYPPPQNDSEIVRKELQDLTVLTTGLAQDQNLLQRFQYYDTKFETAFIDMLTQNGIDKAEVENLIKEIHDDIVPLLVKLKYFYQRVRPYQLAYYQQIDLHPFSSLTADSPSYPSGHAYQSKIYVEVLGNRYPHLFKPLADLGNDVIWSRMYMGLHYASDCDFAVYAAEIVAQHPEFRKKYKL